MLILSSKQCASFPRLHRIHHLHPITHHAPLPNPFPPFAPVHQVLYQLPLLHRITTTSARLFSTISPRLPHLFSQHPLLFPRTHSTPPHGPKPPTRTNHTNPTLLQHRSPNQETYHAIAHTVPNADPSLNQSTLQDNLNQHRYYRVSRTLYAADCKTIDTD